jgi:serine/threonine protein kinase
MNYQEVSKMEWRRCICILFHFPQSLRRIQIRVLVNRNNGLSSIDEYNATDVVMEMLDIENLSRMVPGKYDVINWDFVPNASIMSTERSILDEEIDISEVGIDVRMIYNALLQINGNVAKTDDNTNYYVKYVSSKPKDLFISEVKVLSMLDHPNIIKIKPLVKNENDRIIGMMLPLANIGTLESNMEFEMRSVWYNQIKDAIEYSQRMGFEYTDINVVYVDICIIPRLAERALKSRVGRERCIYAHSLVIHK